MNAPYDARFKILAEEYPDLLLRLFGIIGPGTKTQSIDVVRELQLDPVQIDHAYRLEGQDPPRLAHFEAVTSWRTRRIPLLALYHFLLRHKFKLPVSSYVVLMAEKYAPAVMPARIVYEEEDGIRIEAPYEVIRLWEIDPSIAFEPGSEPLLPWVPLLKGGAAEFEQACAAVGRLCDHPEEAPYPVAVMVSNLATLAVLRYDRDAIARFMKGLSAKMMLSTDLFTETWLYKDGVAAGEVKGEAKGRAEGEAKGRAEGEAKGRAEGEEFGQTVGKRAAIRLMLSQKFPAMGMLPEIDRVDRSEALDELLVAILGARSADDVRTALQEALRVN